MPSIKRDSFRSGPKTFKRSADTKGDPYPERRPSRKMEDFREERAERRPGTRSYGSDRRDGYEKREWEPKHVIRRPPPPRDLPESTRSGFADGGVMQPVPAYKLRKGLEAAKTDITETIDEIAAALLSNTRHLRKMELTLSFGADGRFLGFGTGGAAIVKVTIAHTE